MCDISQVFALFTMPPTIFQQNIINFQRVSWGGTGLRVDMCRRGKLMTMMMMTMVKAQTRPNRQDTFTCRTVTVVVVFFIVTEICNFYKFRKPKWNICRSGTLYFWQSTDCRHSQWPKAVARDVQRAWRGSVSLYRRLRLTPVRIAKWMQIFI